MTFKQIIWIIAGVIALSGIGPMHLIAAPADTSAVQSALPVAPIDLSLQGLFTAIGPVRWGVLALAVMLVSITIAALIFLTMPLSRRYTLASALTSLKEWNTLLSTLLTILGPIGTYIGMIGALLAMHQVAIAVDAAMRLSAQAIFFQKAAEMFISSLAGIGLGMSLGLANSLILHHVLPEHEHPIEGDGMIASTLAILSRWMKRPSIPNFFRMDIRNKVKDLSTKARSAKGHKHENTRPGVDRADHDRSTGVSGGGDFVSVRVHGPGQRGEEPSGRTGDDSESAATDPEIGKHRQDAQDGEQQDVKQIEKTVIP